MPVTPVTPRLLLHNRSPIKTHLLLELNYPLHRRAPTTAVRLPHNGFVDVCQVLKLNRFEARRVVESSHDYQVFRGRLWVDLVDDLGEMLTPGETSDTTNMTDDKKHELKSLVEKHTPHLMSTLNEVIDKAEFGAPPPADTTPPNIPIQVTQVLPPHADAQMKKLMDLHDQPEKQLTYLDESSRLELVEDEAKTAQTLDALEAGHLPKAGDLTPSSKWTREDLFAYAQRKGLDVNETMGKNLLLRKIRGL